METHQHDGIQTKPVHRHIAETEGLAHERNPRFLFAAEFWGHRRFSDPILLQSHGLTTQALRALNLQNGDDSNGNGYNPHALTLRTPFPLPTRREELVDALAHVEIHHVKGLGSIARPAINKSHSSKLLAHFLHHAQRSLLVPVTAAEPAPSLTPIPPVAAARVAAAAALPAPVATVPDPLSQRELGILESELFDTAKYVGGSGARHLTVLTWCEDDQYGSITLFEVDVDERPLPDLRRAATGLAARRRRAPPALLNSHSAGDGRVTGLRPVAAMEDVPRQVLVNMRVDHGLKKAVLQYGKETGRFRWTAQHTRRGQPTFARVVVEPLDDLMQADYGIVATIPQFLALLHASRSTIEKVSSSPATARSVETEGRQGQARARNVLVPDGAKWAEDRIFWTDDGAGAMAELRLKKYRNVIDSESGQPEGPLVVARAQDRQMVTCGR
ncbi:hypothetical protein NEMBOFW57_007863 [Staphylotrichum longicolle]|uniref:Uncharacterized protein n=1 Tax=Staphylotrichum longicolle TaxID=669026 RepID=A0AAD4HXS9_9PEZI|nr:hypothetical protein NEMBOFW57_007863 [Staphylotrichum longicolle]